MTAAPLLNERDLKNAIIEFFSDGELNSLSFGLGVDYDSLPGESKDDKARELIAWMGRRQRGCDLLAACEQERPRFTWRNPSEMSNSEHLHKISKRLDGMQAMLNDLVAEKKKDDSNGNKAIERLCDTLITQQVSITELIDELREKATLPKKKGLVRGWGAR